MTNALGRFIAPLRIGDAACWQNLSMFPLIGACGDAPDYVLLGDALERGEVEVRELEHASVAKLRVVNHSNSMVLICQGDEFVGGRQNRVVHSTVLVAAKTALTVPVSCVESGRWHTQSPTMRKGAKAYPALRREMQWQVSDSLRRAGTRVANQREVWSSVATRLAAEGASSRTEAMHDLFTKHNSSLRGARRALPYVAGATGLIVAVGPKFLGAEIFSREDAARRAWPDIVKSAVLEARGRPMKGAPSLEDARAFLSTMCSAPSERYPSEGLGTELRIETDAFVGALLIHNERPIYYWFLATGQTPTRRQDQQVLDYRAAVHRAMRRRLGREELEAFARETSRRRSG